jgi:hypothetical protein
MMMCPRAPAGSGCADGQLVAGDLRLRNSTTSPASSFNRVIALRDPGQRRARLALPAGGDDHHLAARQSSPLPNRSGFGRSLEIAGRLPDAR